MVWNLETKEVIKIIITKLHVHFMQRKPFMLLMYPKQLDKRALVTLGDKLTLQSQCL